MYYLLRPRSGRPAYRRDLRIHPQQRQMGKRNPCDIVKDSVTALGHPSISPDGKCLYFVSDAVGGFGGKGYFPCPVVGNDFGPMENLGEEINTPGDEMFPYVRDSVTLYFASNGHPGMGGLDLFKATQDKDSTGSGRSRNLGAPHQLYGRRFRYHLRRKRGTGLLLLQPQRRTGL